MSRFVKELITTQLKGQYEGLDSALVVDLTGMDVHSTQELRARLRGKNARLQVVKNALARRAFGDGPLGPLGVALEGPCALVTSDDSIIDAAKVLVEAAKEFQALKLKDGLVEGDPSLLAVADVAKLRSRAEVIGDLVGLFTSPARSLAGCIGGPQARLAGCLKAIVEKEEGEAAAA